MAIVKTAAPKAPRAKKAKKRSFKPEGYALKKDRRPVHLVPWVAQSPQPWRVGYVRVFIPFTASELINARAGKTGHEQIVHNSNLVRV